MLRTTKSMKEKYEKIQNFLFTLIPEKWEEIYLYASVGLEENTKQQEKKGEMFFYYLPKGILKKRLVNVYEVPQRFNINEEQYLKIVDELYECIKSLQRDFKDTEQELWTSFTITIANFKFKIEYCYDELPKDEKEILKRNVIWKHKYLKIDGGNKEENKILDEYYSNSDQAKKETYETGLYVKTDNNTVTFDRDEQFVVYEKDDISDVISKNKANCQEKDNEEDEEEEIKSSKNQILNN